MNVAAKILHKNEDLDQERNRDILMREGDQLFEVREELLGRVELNISHLAGTIHQTEKERMRRLIFRSTRGTALTYFQDIEQPFIDYRGVKTYRTVYIVIYQDGEYFTDKLNRLLASFLSHSFEIGMFKH